MKNRKNGECEGKKQRETAGMFFILEKKRMTTKNVLVP